MQKKIILALTAGANAWKVDLRIPGGNESDLYLNRGDQVDIIVGGTAGTGGQWMYGVSNVFIFGFVDQVYEYLPAREGDLGGPFKLTLKMKANDEIPAAASNRGMLRLAYARPWDFSMAKIFDYESEAWRDDCWNYQVINYQVDDMLELWPKSFYLNTVET